MFVPLIAGLATIFFELLLAATAIFLILLVLVQRGRGGGLAGALGGMGGSSAFGAKAGDVFTRITIGVASFWILLCIVATKYSAPTGSRLDIEGVGTTRSEMINRNAESEEPSSPPASSGAATSDSPSTDTSGSGAQEPDPEG